MKNQPVLTGNGQEKSLVSIRKWIKLMQQYYQACSYDFLSFFSVFYLVWVYFSLFSFYRKSFWSFVYVINYCVGAGLSTLISFSDWSDPYNFRRKMDKTRSVKEELERKLFISRQSRHISFVNIMIKVLFPTLYLYLACKHLCVPPWKGYKKEKGKYSGGDP